MDFQLSSFSLFFCSLLWLPISLGGECQWTDAISTRKLFMEGLDEGLHRRLKIKVEIGSVNRFVECQLAYKFVIPAGAYIDLDSVKAHRTHLFSKSFFDVEAPKEKSRNTPLYVCARRILRKTFLYNDLFEIPIHLRYHRPNNTDAFVKVNAPRLFLKCSQNSSFTGAPCRRYISKAPCDCSSTALCEWFNLPFYNYNAVDFRVPTGNSEIFWIVFTFTLLVVFACVSAICFQPSPSIKKIQ